MRSRHLYNLLFALSQRVGFLLFLWIQYFVRLGFFLRLDLELLEKWRDLGCFFMTRWGYSRFFVDSFKSDLSIAILSNGK